MRKNLDTSSGSANESMEFSKDINVYLREQAKYTKTNLRETCEDTDQNIPWEEYDQPHLSTLVDKIGINLANV